MRIEYRGIVTDEREKKQIWDILCECDREFYPPLSARNSSVQKDLRTENPSEEDRSVTPTVYFDEMIQQYFILAFDDKGEMTGYMTFKKDYICDALQSFGKSLYITTICVRKDYRRQHVMNSLYDCMESEVTKFCGCPRISTRTWSENDAHMHGLAQRGYKLLCRLENDRGPGVDTVYYGREI